MQNAFFLVDHDMVKNILAIFHALNIPLQVGEEKRHIVIKDYIQIFVGSVFFCFWSPCTVT